MTNFILEDSSKKELRYEKKFVLVGLGQKEVERMIKHNKGLFSEIFHERKVNNVYLDSGSLENFRENISGQCNRMKIRIRWYGKMFGFVEKPILELKIKKNELGKKLHFFLEPFYLNEEFSIKTLQEVFSKSKLPEWLKEELISKRPTLLNSYKRKYFISANKKQRITLDWDLAFFRIGIKHNLFLERIKDSRKIIIEVKYSGKDYVETAEIINKLPFSRQVANSKYVSGINLLNF